jgi:flagellar basal body-associated protein FliL
MTDDEAAAKRKKMIKWIIIGSVLTVAIVLAIVLPITLSKSSGGDDPDDPPPVPPPEPPLSNETQYNPYEVVYRTVDDETNAKGLIKASEPYNI